MSDSQPTADDPSKLHRKLTVALVGKQSGETIRYAVLESHDSPLNRLERYCDEFVKELIAEMSRGEERTFLLYERVEGLRPCVKDVTVINKPKTIRWERSVMGHRGPGATGAKRSHSRWMRAKVPS